MTFYNIQQFANLPNEILELSEVFKINGKKLYIVGGWCRDTLIGKDFQENH